MPLQKPGITEVMAYTEIELKQINLTELCEIFFASYSIPLGLFDREGNLQKQFFGPGRRQTSLYLTDSAAVLHTEYNAALQAMCKRADTVYVDNDDIADRYMDSLWEPDGIHQRYDFYPYWAKNLLLGVVAADFDLDSTAELYEQTGNS